MCVYKCYKFCLIQALILMFTMPGSKYHFLHLCVLVILFVTSQSYDSSPENTRQSGRSQSVEIFDAEIENDFKLARERILKRNLLEKQLAGEGRNVNNKIRSAESTHQQASSTSMIREMKDRQLQLEEASNILAQKSSEQVSCDLTKQQLNEPPAINAPEACTSTDTIVCDDTATYRTQDGTCNNLNRPTWGSARSCFRRILAPNYTGDSGFRKSVNGLALPSPRTLSLNVHSNAFRPTYDVNHMYMFYGQLLDHEITSTPFSVTDTNTDIQCCPPSPNNHPQCAEINITATDPFYSKHRVTCLNFVRSVICPYCTEGPRSQINSVTTFIDGSFLYGNSVTETNSLRSTNGTLGIQESAFGDLLLASNNPNNDQCSLPAQNQICFRSGDFRVNQHPTLTSIHTLFLREHNRIARSLGEINSEWNEETIFQEARKIVGAEMQVIAYKEFLPITLGEERMTYFNLSISQNPTSYDENLNPTLFTEFSTAAYRFGHTLINSMVAENPIRSGHAGHLLRDIFFYPFDIYTGEMDPLLTGATKSSAQNFDRYMVPDVTNYLYRRRGNATGLDLASANIQRGRDHGLQGYTKYVYFCSQVNVTRFEDLVRYSLMAPENMELLKKFYRNVGDIDLFTGCISEKKLNGAQVGPTAACMIGLQFNRLKFGDRFYFQHQDQPGSFTPEQVVEINEASLAGILCDNTAVTQMQRKAMMFESLSNPMESCSQKPRIDLTAWETT